MLKIFEIFKNYFTKLYFKIVTKQPNIFMNGMRNDEGIMSRGSLA